MQRILRNSPKCRKKIGKTCGSRDAVWKTAKHRENERKAKDWQWKGVQNNVWLCCGIMSLRDYEKNLCSLKTMRITLQEKDLLLWHIKIWCTSVFRCQKRWKFRMQKLPWTRNGRSSRQPQHGIWKKSRARRRSFWKHKETKREVHFATLMDMCHLKNAELEPTLQKYKGRVVLRRDIVRWLWSPRSFHWARLVCVPDHCCKNNGWCCKITRLWRTSSWCSICLFPSKIGGRSQIAQNSKVRVSRRMDSSTTTQMDKIMGKIEIPWYFLIDTCTVIHEPDCHGKDNSKKLH